MSLITEQGEEIAALRAEIARLHREMSWSNTLHDQDYLKIAALTTERDQWIETFSTEGVPSGEPTGNLAESIAAWRKIKADLAAAQKLLAVKDEALTLSRPLVCEACQKAMADPEHTKFSRDRRKETLAQIDDALALTPDSLRGLTAVPENTVYLNGQVRNLQTCGLAQSAPETYSHEETEQRHSIKPFGCPHCGDRFYERIWGDLVKCCGCGQHYSLGAALATKGKDI